MTKQKRYEEDGSNAFDANGGLKDGRSMRVSLTMCDSLQKSVAEHAANLRDARLTDEQLALHRPGYRIGATDTAARDIKEIARAEYIFNLENAYKNPMHAATGEIIGTREGDVCTINGSPGHLRMIGGKLTCIPDQRQDAMTDIAAVYAAYDAEISQRWRG